ncbi:HEAT repeat domain-containing protein [Leptospira fletcheri]|uniref:HEAT repeat domain-containing protein n=1 Tax=Leptospira fletcheri TaxID=2484981 RepID=A0A4R9G416_9LEPT|nr:HEAT repeat domain-containing protein [Leptospira fletcheri]TGK06246.1 HEAT repeat domain-containing protein [Leptospira fletcheri]
MNSTAESRNSKKRIENSNRPTEGKRRKEIGISVFFRNFCLALVMTLALLFVSRAEAGAKEPPKPKYTAEQIKKKKEVLLQILKYGTTKERAGALRELEDFPKEDAGELYDLVGVILSKDPDWSMRIYALRICGTLELTNFEDKIVALLKSDQQEISKEAIYVTKKLKFQSAIPTLTELLKTQDFTKNSNYTIALIDTLAEFPEATDAFQTLESRFQEKFNDPELRAQTALYFGKVKNGSVENLLISTFKDDKEPITIRAYSVNSLGKMKSKDAIQPMTELLAKIRNLKSKTDVQDYQALKIHIITALVSLGDKDIIEELYSLARDDDAVVRLRAIKHLAETEDPAVLEILEYKAQRDPSEKVKRAAQNALNQLKKKISPDFVPPAAEKPREPSGIKRYNSRRPSSSREESPARTDAGSPSSSDKKPDAAPQGGSGESEDLEDQ